MILIGDSRFEVSNVLKDKGGKFLHYGVLSKGSIKVDDVVCASIDVERRKAIMRAHSATHLLDAALKKVLGDHVHQAGSLVEPDRLRFDFTHFEAITPEQLAQIDKLVNDAILEGYPVATEVLPIEEAKKLGALGAFISGAGPSIVAIVYKGDRDYISRAQELCEKLYPHWKAVQLRCDEVGATVKRL